MKRILAKVKTYMTQAHDALVRFIAEGGPKSTKRILTEQMAEYTKSLNLAERKIEDQRRSIAEKNQLVDRYRIRMEKAESKASEGHVSAAAVFGYTQGMTHAIREIRATMTQPPAPGEEPLEYWERRANDKLEEAEVAIMGLSLQARERGELQK